MQMRRSAKPAPKSPRAPAPTTTTRRTRSSGGASSEGSKAKSHGAAASPPSSASPLCGSAGLPGVPPRLSTSAGTMVPSSPSSASRMWLLPWKWPAANSSRLRTSSRKQRLRKLKRSSTVITGAVRAEAARVRHHSHWRHCSVARWLRCSRAAARWGSWPASASPGWPAAGGSSRHSGSTATTAVTPGMLRSASPAECRG
mmetsp:Transcript_156596/g.480438  ORF Transcript_156596/g.480438 Transcript_156596/m.480438 type:complete len:200 (+) Transcript_156596:104-703(+)